jgi:BirA family biotin operon repressor/biotin-[acetyl-CoA-carboxylase] ligase
MTLAPQPRDLPTFYRHTALGEVTSTNDEARTWQSPEGNLYLSLILRPADALAGAAAIGFAGVLSVADAAEGVLGEAADIALKWPNDVLIGGRKAAGLMIESTGGKGGDALILGVGINVCWHPSDLPYPATDLHAAGGREANVESVLRAFCEHFHDRYRQWQGLGFTPLRAAWISRAKGLGEALSVDIEGRRFDGIFEGIDDDGALCLDLGASGIKKVTAGDVFFTDTSRRN